MLSDASFTPQANMPVTATVGSVECGYGRTLDVDGQIVYTVKVLAEGEKAGCGATGRTVAFRVGARDMASTGSWNNTQAIHLPLGGAFRVYLPLIRKDG